jgi:hypothetical protein
LTRPFEIAVDGYAMHMFGARVRNTYGRTYPEWRNHETFPGFTYACAAPLRREVRGRRAPTPSRHPARSEPELHPLRTFGVGESVCSVGNVVLGVGFEQPAPWR